jgi:adenine phosphoribosyltransferase
VKRRTTRRVKQSPSVEDLRRLAIGKSAYLAVARPDALLNCGATLWSVSSHGRGSRPSVDEIDELRKDLHDAFRWRGDRVDAIHSADPTGWWASAAILASLGPALAELFSDINPTVVLGPQSRGALLGALVATHLNIGLIEMRKDPCPAADSDRWLIAHTPPDHRDRNLRVGVRREHLASGARVLLVDDWADTGGQASAARTIVNQAGATWCGAALVVDALADSRLRRDLGARSILRVRDL